MVSVLWFQLIRPQSVTGANLFGGFTLLVLFPGPDSMEIAPLYSYSNYIIVNVHLIESGGRYYAVLVMDGYLILVCLNRGNVMMYDRILEINITEVSGHISSAVAIPL